MEVIQNDPVLMGLVVGGCFGVLYILLTGLKRREAQWAEFVTVTLSITGILSGMQCIYILGTEKADKLGALADYRLMVLLGSASIIWLSAEQVGKIYRKIINYQPEPANQKAP